MLEQVLRELFIKSFKTLYGQEPPVQQVNFQKTRPEFEGDMTIVVFPFVKLAGRNPEQLANEMGAEMIKESDMIAKFNVVKGFLNLLISDKFWMDFFKASHENREFGRKPVSGKNVVIEYSSPNTNKPLHLGHIRNNLLGWSVSEIMKANGKKVVRVNLVNDRGIHICKSMLAWLKWGNGCTPESTGKKGDHLIGDFYVLFDKKFKEEVKSLLPADYDTLDEKAKEEAKAKAEAESTLMQEAREMLVKWEANDPEVRHLWETMNQWVYDGFDVTYKRMGVAFEKIYYESQTYLLGKALVQEGLEKGVLYRRDDNSVWCDLRDEGLDEKLLLRRDGTSVYMTQDLGTAQLRVKEYDPEKLIYVVGNEQIYHFDVLKRVLVRLGREWGNSIEHLSYGMVELPNGKMKSREGTVVDADDLIATMIADARRLSEDKVNKLENISEEERQQIARIVGMGALKYFILKVDARKNMLFNPEESIDFNGNTGPFIQYTHARIRSILRKAQDEAPSSLVNAQPNAKETTLIQKLNEFPAAVEQAGKDYSPSGIANYCYELTKEFNQFYHDYSILNAESDDAKALRLVIARNVAKTLKNGMALLGIEVPERM